MFLSEPPRSSGRDAAYEGDRADNGYVDNLTRIWTWRPEVLAGFTDLRATLQDGWALSDVDRAVLVTATARSRGDSYCSLAWGARLAELLGDAAAAEVITGSTAALDDRVAVLSSWAAAVVQDPNGIGAGDVEELRRVGLDDRAIFEATAFVAFRLAFSTVNDALGAEPDRQLSDSTPDAVRAAVSYGRPAATSPSR